MRYKGFDINIVEIDCRDTDMIGDHRLIQIAKVSSLLHKKGTSSRELLNGQIKAARFSLKNKTMKAFQILVKQKDNYYYQTYSEHPKSLDIRETLNNFKVKLKGKRLARSQAVTEVKNMLGFKYETVGGTFTKPNSIVTIANSVDHLDRIQTPKKPNAAAKNNYIGIELELFCKLNRTDLLQKFITAKLSGYVYVKDDGSLRPDEGTKAHEVTILCRQDDVSSVVPRIISVLRSKDCDAAVNNSCGMHIHIDARNRDPYAMFNRLVNSLPLLVKLVPKERSSNKYCEYNKSNSLGDYYNDNIITNGARASSREERYKAINPMSVVSHKTIEVRLHSGSLNSKKIINWVDICTSIVDSNGSVLHTPEDFFLNVKQDQSLLTYMIERANLFSKGALMDTKADYIIDVASGF